MLDMTAHPLAADLDDVLGATRELWLPRRRQRIFLTGGTGFFGCWLLESFLWINRALQLESELHVLTRNVDAFQKKMPHLAADPALHFHTGDIRDFDFPAGEFQALIHAATDANTTWLREQPLTALDTIVAGTRHVLDFARVAQVRDFLFTSSGAVYGNQPSDLTHVPEEYPGAPDPLVAASVYGEGKRLAEHLCCLYAIKHPDLAVKIARCFAFVGPYLPLDAHFAIGNFIRDSLRGGPIVVRGDGQPCRSYLDAADLAIWLWTILWRGANQRAYNVGSDESLSIVQVAKLVQTNIQPPPPIQISQQPQPGPVPRYVPSIQRARQELGLSPRIDACRAIQKTVRWHVTSAS